MIFIGLLINKIRRKLIFAHKNCKDYKGKQSNSDKINQECGHKHQNLGSIEIDSDNVAEENPNFKQVKMSCTLRLLSIRITKTQYNQPLIIISLRNCVWQISNIFLPQIIARIVFLSFSSKAKAMTRRTNNNLNIAIFFLFVDKFQEFIQID